MKRAEDLKNALEQQNQPSQPKGGSTGIYLIFSVSVIAFILFQFSLPKVT